MIISINFKLLLILSIICLFDACVKETKDINEFSIQARLDAGESIREVLKGNLIHNVIGKAYEGGVIFKLNTQTGEGMVIAMSNQSDSVEWGCNMQNIGANNIEIGTGQANTALIQQNCPLEGTPADLCEDLVLNGYDDWYLPSSLELYDAIRSIQIWSDAIERPATGSRFWSSSESSSSTFSFAYSVVYDENESFPNLDDFFKSDKAKVRAIRTFDF